MELISGNIFIRVPDAPMVAGDIILGHRHNFDHTTYVNRGALQIELLSARGITSSGDPIEATVDSVHIIRATDPINWVLILAGRFHLLRALEDGTIYHCIYAHQKPQAMTFGNELGFYSKPVERRDEDGSLWVRVNENITQTTSEWVEAYR